MDYRNEYEKWLSLDCFDVDTKAELKAIADDENEIKERFYKELEFGTAGLRGIIRAGLNGMNIYTVRKASQGLADYINEVGAAGKGVAIAYDSRHMSREFAETAACCLAANGIKAYVFESLRPTPELSFAVRHLGCTAGINITASHNPAEYNGYKVYWEDGAQITPPHDTGITEKVLARTDFATLKTMTVKEAEDKGLFITIGAEVDDAYMAELKKQIKAQGAIDKYGKEIKIVYTPLHGTGNIPVRRILKEIGFEHVYVVPEQELPDGDFPTVKNPNPESEAAFALGLKMAKELDADLILATDPDADRLGVYVKDKAGEYHALTGNMSGCFLAEYEVARTSENGGIPVDGAIIKSIVSSNMAKAIADYYHVELIDVLTGFKYIGGKMLEFETSCKGTYLFGFEESYGCLIGTHARDKDAVVASMALCEAAAFYKGRGMTLWDAMIEMYERYGYYREDVVSIELKGIDGAEKIKSIMATLRGSAPKTIGGYDVIRVRDYKDQTIIDTISGEVKNTGLPIADVLYYDLPNNSWVCVRPSGTEPKIKIYVGISAESIEASVKACDALIKAAVDMINAE